MWRQSYITRVPEAERIAWIYPHEHGSGRAAVVPSDAVRSMAQVRDVSLGGIILVASRRFESGALLKVEVPSFTGKPPLWLLTRVIQVNVQSESCCLLSCCFAKELSDEDLKLFGVERLRASGPADHRAWVRFPCQAKTSLRAVVSAASEQETAQVINISAGGLAVQASRPYESGTLLSLELGGGGQPARTVQARVVHAVPQPNGQWLLGCTFVSELGEQDLLALME